MKRIPRILLTCASVLALLVAATAVFLTAFVDPNDFKPNIEALAFEATGKQLELRGDLSLSFFPRLSIEAGPAELHDSPAFGSEPFARVEKISASIELVPLFQRKLKIRSLLISGVRLKLVVNSDGKNNWAAGEKNSAPAAAQTAENSPKRPAGLSELALNSLKLEDILVTYTDKQAKTNLEFTVARLALDSLEVGKKTTLDLEAYFSGPVARPLPLVMEADFTLPSSLAQGLIFNLSGTLDKTPVSFKGVFAMPGTPEQPLTTLKGDIELGDVNLDAYLPASRKTEEKKNGAEKAAAELDHADQGSAQLAAVLHPLQIDLRVAAQSVTVSGVPASGIKATIKADQGQVVAKPVAMTVAKGGVTLEATLDAREKGVRTRFTGEWKNADLGELLRAATGKASFTGTGNAVWSLNATGVSWPEAVRALNGTASASLANGSLPGFTLIPRGVANLPAKTLDITGIRGSSSWKVAQGVAVSEDLEVRAAAGLSATGKGRVDIPAQSLRYALSINLPALPELPELKVLPVIVSGPFSALSYSIDQPALLREMAKSLRVPSVKAGGEAGRELTRELGKGLDKLLGR